MEKKEVEIGSPIAIGGIRLIPVTAISRRFWRYKCGISFLGVKQPLGIIVISPAEKKAFQVSGEEISLDKLGQEVPEIRNQLNDI